MKALALRVSNVLLYLVSCSLAATGLLLEFRMEGRGSAAVWGIPRHEWTELHLIIALVFLALAVLHVALNWNWIKGLFHGPRRWAFLAAGCAGLILFTAILAGPSGPSGSQGPLREQHHGLAED